MSAELTDWTDVLAIEDLEPERLTPVKRGDKALILYRTGDALRAFDGKCPHKGAPMEQGAACAFRHSEVHIVCPWHKAIFSGETGRLIEPPALDPLVRYPVMVREGRILVGKQPIKLPVPRPVRAEETVAIVGAGAAGVAAAVTLREEGFAGRVVLISPEAAFPYDRTALSKAALSAESADGSVPLLRDAAWYERNHVERLTDRVTSLNLETRTIMLEQRGTLAATHILLASGSRAKTLTVPGVDLKGVYHLRSVDDLTSILAHVGNTVAAVVIGVGFVGLEAAAALRKRGAGVTVVAQDDLPFEKQLGREIGKAVRSLHEAKGVAFLSSCRVVSLQGAREVESATLDDGSVIGTSLVLIAVGAQPVLDYLPDYPLNLNGGLDVDRTMQFAPGFYAAGDIASVEHVGSRYRIDHWRTAQSQARIAARAMLGLPCGDLPTPWFWTQHYERKIEYLGWPLAFDRIEYDGALDRFDFTAQFIKGDKTVGIAMAGRSKEMSAAVITFEDA